MLEIEEVIVNDGEVGYGDAEYLTDEHSEAAPAANIKVKLNLSTGMIVKNTLPVVSAVSSIAPCETSGESAVPVKKTPIIRKAGEVVTPVQKPCGIVTVSPSTAPIRPKVEWSKVTPPGLNTPFSTFTSSTVDVSFEQDLKGDEMIVDEPAEDLNNAPDHEQYTYTEEASGTVDLFTINDKLSRIEQMLEQVIDKQKQHDAALKAIKFNIKDLRAEIKYDRQSSGRDDNSSNAISHPIPMKRERKRLVVFPIADDNYLLRLEDLIQVDAEIRTDLSELFGEAPAISVYEFMRKNIHSLFEHTSKYTWTGKAANNVPSTVPSNPAHKLAIVDLLLSCGCEKFPYMSRDIIEKEFRRALTNFNESKVIRLKRRQEKSNASQSLLEMDA